MRFLREDNMNLQPPILPPSNKKTIDEQIGEIDREIEQLRLKKSMLLDSKRKFEQMNCDHDFRFTGYSTFDDEGFKAEVVCDKCGLKKFVKGFNVIEK
jgi:hypothetical protein